MVRMRAGTPGADRIAEIRDAHGRFMSPFFVSFTHSRIFYNPKFIF